MGAMVGQIIYKKHSFGLPKVPRDDKLHCNGRGWDEAHMHMHMHIPARGVCARVLRCVHTYFACVTPQVCVDGFGACDAREDIIIYNNVIMLERWTVRDVIHVSTTV